MSDPSPAPASPPELEVQNAVRSRRTRLGLSKRELGRRARLSAAYVSALEAGKLNPSFAAFARLAFELRLTPSEVFVLVRHAALTYKAEADDHSNN